MEQLSQKFKKIQDEIIQAASVMNLDQLMAERAKLQKLSQQPDFWQDNKAAQEVMQKLSTLDKRLEPWESIRRDTEDAILLSSENDPALQEELQQQLTTIGQHLDRLKQDLRYSGPYDDYDAIITLTAGAGGTDAQDWTQILFRMYSRWAESNNYNLTELEHAVGEEAGLKRVTFEVSGNLAYGKLRGEHGVHRLVRLSPFNSDNLRQTSFAKVDVLPKIINDQELAIDPKDIRVDVYRAGGHGGQSVNTTDSAVRVTHLPTGITAAIQNERSQLQNKELALTILRSRLAQLQQEQHQEKLAEIKGPNEQAAWGNQIRSYVLHPYKQVKDLRSKYETSDAAGVLDGNLQPFIESYLDQAKN